MVKTSAWGSSLWRHGGSIKDSCSIVRDSLIMAYLVHVLFIRTSRAIVAHHRLTSRVSNLLVSKHGIAEGYFSPICERSPQSLKPHQCLHHGNLTPSFIAWRTRTLILPCRAIFLSSLRLQSRLFVIICYKTKKQCYKWIPLYHCLYMNIAAEKFLERKFLSMSLNFWYCQTLKGLHQFIYLLLVPVGLLWDTTLRKEKGWQASQGEKLEMLFVFHTPRKHCWRYFGGPWVL